ncbi:MAG: ribonuclease [Crocinitomicaceae bacterium]|nr:ribonuclease [Crocinitomicaceae bacterium]|tara:strand:- start:16694 stop:18037 length:1344 start_codon:yes stop_codon:yes gene_type:complete
MPRKKNSSKRKIFVLDTSVILFDHNAVKSFEENDVAIPITVLEELDNFKKGNDTKNYEAREFIRFVDSLAGKSILKDWIKLDGPKSGRFRVVMHNLDRKMDANKIFSEKKADHNILNAAITLAEEEKDAEVQLVTKDINLRLKAKAVGISAADYETGKIEDIDNLYLGKTLKQGVDAEILEELYRKGFIHYSASYEKKPINNHYFILKNGKSSTLAYFNPITENFERLEKQPMYGVMPRNAEQTFAIHALSNPEIKLVTLQGVAGTGKTLLALSSAIEQAKNYKQILLARPIVPLSNKDIGYLPGDVKSKLNPYMEPLWDNLKYIKNQFKETEKAYKKIEEMVTKEKLLVTPLAYIRGRSLSNVFFIVDEAQNLTPHEVKTIISRAGENAKIIFTGDVHQIDSPYLDSQSNGLSYLIDRLKGNSLFAHITLEKGERSELANLANELL